MTVLASPSDHADSPIGSPDGWNQAMSPSSDWPPWSALPAKNRRRRKTACSRRSLETARVNA